MAKFIWMKGVNGYTPQIIFDQLPKMYGKQEIVGTSYNLKPNEVGMTINALTKLYPCKVEGYTSEGLPSHARPEVIQEKTVIHEVQSFFGKSERNRGD